MRPVPTEVWINGSTRRKDCEKYAPLLDHISPEGKRSHNTMQFLKNGTQYASSTLEIFRTHIE